jgi:hypothetical protein
MSIVDRIRLSYPLPIAKLYESMDLESEPRQRVRALIELFEGISRYLVLTGLSSYIYHELSDPKVEEFRPQLERASLGSWIELLIAIDAALRSNDTSPLLINPKAIDKEGSGFEAYRELGEIATGILPKTKRPGLSHFFRSVVEFRNKKIGHGRLSALEANRVLEPLESAVSQWLSELPSLHEQHLVHIDRVEWRDPRFVCYGTSLNSGTSLIPFKVTRNDPVTYDHLYLFQPANGSLIPLYPFFIFDTHTQVLYAYDEFSSTHGLILRCPYESAGAEPARYVSYDESIITGVGPKVDSIECGGDKETPQGAAVSEFVRTINLIRANLSESWLTDSQSIVWTQLQKLMGPPYYVVNIYGAAGTGKTFLGWLLEKQGRAAYASTDSAPWQSWQGQPLVVLDDHDSSRRAVRSLRAQLQLWGIGQAIVLTRQRAQDDIPCLHLAVTEWDIQIAKATLYRELEVIIPEGDHRNLWDCLKELEGGNDR